MRETLFLQSLATIMKKINGLKSTQSSWSHHGSELWSCRRSLMAEVKAEWLFLNCGSSLLCVWSLRAEISLGLPGKQMFQSVHCQLSGVVSSIQNGIWFWCVHKMWDCGVNLPCDLPLLQLATFPVSGMLPVFPPYPCAKLPATWQSVQLLMCSLDAVSQMKKVLVLPQSMRVTRSIG